MNDLITILGSPSTLVLMLAPPAWGKTSLLLNLYDQNDIKIIYLSPLRAIAEELFNRFDKKKHIYKLNKKKECAETVLKFSKAKKAFLITTCELLDDEMIEVLAQDKAKTIFIFDEFHLFYYWGESFREKMWETFLGVCNTKVSVLGLSATVDDSVMEKIVVDMKLGMEHFYILNLGNQQLKKMPENNHFFYFRNQLIRRFIYEMDKNENKTILFFCRYRASVDSWVSYYRRKKVNVLGCVGGKAQEFILELKENPHPRCIFATSVLGHGVNLPAIEKVFIDYEEDNLDFYIQMAGRGGRYGENFELYSLNKQLFYSKKKQLISFIKAFIFDMFYLKLRLHLGLKRAKQNRGNSHSQSNTGGSQCRFQAITSQWKNCFHNVLWGTGWWKKNETKYHRTWFHAQGRSQRGQSKIQ